VQLEYCLPKRNTNDYHTRIAASTLWILDSRPQRPMNQLSTIWGQPVRDTPQTAPMLDLVFSQSYARPKGQMTLKCEICDTVIGVLMPAIWDSYTWWLRLSLAMWPPQPAPPAGSTPAPVAAPAVKLVPPPKTLKELALDQLYWRSWNVETVELKLRDVGIICLELPNEPDAPGSLVLNVNAGCIIEVRRAAMGFSARFAPWACLCGCEAGCCGCVHSGQRSGHSVWVPSQVGDDKEGAALEGEIYLALARATQGNGGKVLCSLTDHLMEPMNVTWKYTGTVRARLPHYAALQMHAKRSLCAHLQVKNGEQVHKDTALSIDKVEIDLSDGDVLTLAMIGNYCATSLNGVCSCVCGV
jgi:hypothetical protein